MGMFQLQGNATAVHLVGVAGTFAPGPVPAGTYTIQAAFGRETQMVTMSDFVVTEGRTYTVHCSATFMVCKVR